MARSLEDAIEKFDSVKVQSIFEFLNWVWITPVGKKIPNIKMINDTIIDLGRSCRSSLASDPSKTSTWVETGGIRVNLRKIDGEEEFSIEFIPVQVW